MPLLKRVLLALTVVAGSFVLKFGGKPQGD